MLVDNSNCAGDRQCDHYHEHGYHVTKHKSVYFVDIHDVPFHMPAYAGMLLTRVNKLDYLVDTYTHKG